MAHDLASAQSSGGWYWQNPLPQGNHLNSISAANTNNAWAVGSNGTIMKTADGGAHWTFQDSGTEVELTTVCALDTSTVWAAGVEGVIIRTIDGGLTWTSLGPGSSFSVKKISAVSADIAWVQGGFNKILKTTDGGLTWTEITTGFYMEFKDLSAVSAETAWVVGVEQWPNEAVPVLQTKDGGLTWHERPPEERYSFNGVCAVSPKIIWAAAGGTVYRTADAGKNWSKVYVPTSYPPMRMDAANGNTAWLVGDGGTIAKVFDKGNDYEVQDPHTTADLYGVCAVDSDTAWVVGEYGTILRTGNGGATWVSQSSGFRNGLTSISAVDGNTAWAGGTSAYRTTDGGRSWVEKSIGSASVITALSAVDSNTVWGCGNGYSSTGGFIIRTIDGGNTWSRWDYSTTTFMEGISAVDADTVWVVGYSVGTGGDSFIKHTSNGGMNWTTQASTTDFRLYDVDAADTECVWAVGSGGNIMETTDGGGNWSTQQLRTDSELRDVCAVARGRAWAAGLDFILKLDGDGSWKETKPAYGYAPCISAVDMNTAWIAGSSIVKTGDGGASWVMQHKGVCGDFEGVAAVDRETAWAVGDGGAILRTDNGGGFVPVDTWYLAEGYTGAGFQEYVCLGNPNQDNAHVAVTFMFCDGSTQVQELELPAYSRATVDVNSTVGSGREVSCRIDASRQIVVERPMYFSYHDSWLGGHDVMGARNTSTSWYFAEGYTGAGFEEWLCVMNPGGSPAELTLKFQTQEEGEKVVAGLVVAPHSRSSFKVNDVLGPDYQTSLELRSSLPVVAERPIYFDYRGMGAHAWRGGHCVVGSTSLRNEYYFAEGTTRYPAFEEWLTLQNPNDETIEVHAAYQLGPGQGDPIEKSYEVPARSRRTLFAEDEVGRDKDLSVRLYSESLFLAERPMYFDYNYKDISAQGGHCVIGACSPASTWFFAEGCTGDSFNQWLCLQNPSDEKVDAYVIYFTQEVSDVRNRRVTLPAKSRVTLMINEQAGPGHQLSCKVAVVGEVKIVAERPMYFSFMGRDGGHDEVGYVLEP